MIVDAFTAADLGIQNWFRSMSVAGTSVGAWWDALGTYIWQVWDYVINKLNLGWTTFVFEMFEAGAKVKRFFLRVGLFISQIFYKALNTLTMALGNLITTGAKQLGGLGLISKKTQGEYIKKARNMETAMRKAANTSTDYYKNAIKESLAESESDWEKYYTKVDKLDAEYTANAKKWQETRNRIFAQDDRKKSAAGPTKPEGGIDIMGMLGGVDWKAMMDELSGKYKETTDGIVESTEQMTTRFQTLAPTVAQFLQGTLGQIFELATDPEVQALGQANQQMFGVFEARLDMLRNYGERHNEILEQIATSSLTVAEKQAAKEMAIEDHKRAVMLSGVASLLSAGLSLLASGGKKQFKLYKALAIAEAGIATYSAYNKALASPPGPPATIPLAASILVMGLAKVRQIAMMQPGTGVGGGGGGGGATTNFGARPPEGGLLGQSEEEQKTMPDKYTIIIENIHGSADEEFADMLAEKIADRSGDGREFGFETTTR